MTHFKPGPHRPLLERFFERFTPGRPEDCWPWRGSVTASGYGQIKAGEEHVAHRVSYLFFRGPIPKGKKLDHICHNRDKACVGGPSCPHRRCVNPWHLEIVTTKENVLRGRGLTADNARKTHCPLNHPLSGENLYLTPQGARHCRQCHAIASARRIEKVLTGATVTNRDNATCNHGHELSGDNVRITKLGYRTCRTCRNETKLAYYYRQKEKQPFH